MIFDIETIPTEAALAAPYPRHERTPPGNFKNEETIARWYAEDEERWMRNQLSDCALDPRRGRVVAIGYGWGSVKSITVGRAIEEEDEAKLLSDFWTQAAVEPILVGFNSMSFDLPFLMVRSLLLGVPVIANLPDYLRRYSYRPHFDVRMALGLWDTRAEGKLREWGEAFGCNKTVGSGAQVFGWVKSGEWGKLNEHLCGDVETTMLLARRIGAAFGVPYA